MILVLCCLVFGKTLSYDLVYLDDAALLFKHGAPQWSDLLGVLERGVWARSEYANPSHYRPMYSFTATLAHLASGGALWAQHLASLLIHILACGLLHVFLLRMGVARALAFSATLLFAVHPFAVETVAWVGAVEQLLTAFVLASLLCAIRYFENGKLMALTGVTFFSWLALLSKEVALVLPAILALTVCTVGRDHQALMSAHKTIARKRLAAILGCSVFSILVYIGLRINAVGAVVPGIGIDWVQSLNIAAQGIWTYLQKSLIPLNLSTMQTLRLDHVVLGWVVAAPLAWLLFRSSSARRGHVALGVAWFALFLLPTFSAASTYAEGAFALRENRGYLPLIGILLLVLETDLAKQAQTRIVELRAVSAFLILMYGAISFAHADRYKDGMAFWRNAVESSPDLAFAHLHLADMYMLHLSYEQAQAGYRRALELNPREYTAHNNLGVLYLRSKRFAEAEAEFYREQELFPGDMRSLENLGLALAKQDKWPEAEKIAKRLIETVPGNQVGEAILSQVKSQEKTPAR